MLLTSLRNPIAGMFGRSTATTTLSSHAQPASANFATGIATVASAVANFVKQLKEDDKVKRAKFTQRTVAELSLKYPGYNFVITRHKQSKATGEAVVHKLVEMQQNVGTVEYDIYASPKGKRFIFKLNGDCGYLNWAYCGDFKKSSKSSLYSKIK